ncbi:sugar phosphate isomerase/epimerase [Comamonas sp. BIGb0124]|uniref:sugar phosphate isomerase/epimerase family protein n=1 Tax=Comamonas sp. BIGb0124 TaxID=2485130 RepID=UPI000F47163D|nr:TIM barrel protein [Comamonas sp. BIGb0124]ROR16403.1 sugar phosphate isomerase/epimerase [Comamonas sp. BIGb0124]
MTPVGDFCVDLDSLAGPLPQRLAEVRKAGLTAVVARAEGLAGQGDAIEDWQGLRLAALSVALDYEGLDGALHQHKLNVAKSLLLQCRRLRCRTLVIEASTLAAASRDFAHTVRDLRKLALLAVPPGLRIALRAHPGASHVRDFMVAADLIQAAEQPNLGLALDVREWLAEPADLSQLEGIAPESIFMVQLADALQPVAAPAEGPSAALVPDDLLFPGEGLHRARLQALVERLHRVGFAGDYVFWDVQADCRILPDGVVARRARRAADWLAEDVLRRSQPLSALRRRVVG